MAEAKTTTTRTPKPKVDHVITAVAAILDSLSVDKKGTLPANMGGGAYIRANDLFQAYKVAAAEQKVLILPNEEVVSEWNENGAIHITIQGRYTFLSTVDESELEVSAVGDGLARNTAIASNVASTNAMKNALMRLALTGESSSDEAAKKGIERENDAHPPQQVSRPAAGGSPLRDRIRTEYIETGKVTPDRLNELFAQHKKDTREESYEALYEYLKSGGE